MRARSLESLPFIVGMNPFIARTLQAHRRAFQFLIKHPPVKTLEDNARFIEQLAELVQSHANDIPAMAKGFQECARYLTPEQISEFLDSTIRNRIAVRLIAEQHIAISRDLARGESEGSGNSHLGVVDPACSPKEMIGVCGSFVSDLCEATLGASPQIVIDGDADATFAYVPVHLEYILTEVLKNSFRATVEWHQRHHAYSSATPIPPIVITIAAPPHADASHPAPARYLSLRIRDQGGGVPPANMSRIFSYSFTTAGRGAEGNGSSWDDEGMGGGPYAAQHIGGSAAIDAAGGSGGGHGGGLFAEMAGRGVQMGMGTIAGLGYGLPMSRLYARYFGGSFDFKSLDGWGSDVFIKLRCLDDGRDIEI
ncbi:[3-methyl-2-oxobutanoate dehydrogenase [lipoamide]] kinase, mitochondrial [Trametes pubescens]|uniref:Protein-serine/threonine kinase n=1 Tax=Trametes pubescens TaxID=154538 RepID=A0A1M2W2V8_TRAPU|nr:[3-methyl-2-oxobutanoate dehydrogenase [lipoamide]] kinase, mitochondrial [Trametes pubescens]